MMTAFYKQKPTVDTPYRLLAVQFSPAGWKVRLSGGTKWGQEQAKELRVISAKSFEEAQKSFDEVFGELKAQGWKPYSPFEPW